FDPEQVRVHGLVQRVAEEHDVAAVEPLGPVLGEERCALRRQPRIGLAQPGGDFIERTVRLETGRILQLVEPLRIADRCLVRPVPREAQALKGCEAPDAGWPDAGIHGGDDAAHAVPDDPRRAVRLVAIEVRFEIGVVVGEPVTLPRPFGRAEATPVRGNELPLARKAVHQELERCRHVHPAVQQEHSRRAGLAPDADVVAQSADRVKFRATCLHHQVPIIMPERRRILPKLSNRDTLDVLISRARVAAVFVVLAVLAAIPAGAAERFGEGLLWRIDGKGAPASHVFGTIHLSDKRVTDLPSAVAREFKQSRSLTIEAGLDLSTLAALANRMIYTDGRDLPGVAGDELFKRTAVLAAGLGLPEPLVRMFKPWAVAMLFSAPQQDPSGVLD